ncbi:hypothetical protein ACS0TY_015234 [Phlomoides rotata]
MPNAAAATTILHLLFLSFTFRPLSSTSTVHRRILHQPFLPLDSSPPPTPTPPSPSPPKYPFTTSTSTPDNSPFFPSYPSPPSPPSPASLATFPANISSLAVPGHPKPKSSSSKLIFAAIASVIAAVAVVSLAVFLHLRRRTRRTSSVIESKTLGSDTCSTISFNQPPNTHHIPKLQRPSQTSAEFLYLGTLVNSHAPGGGAAFHGSGNSTTYYNNAACSRKLDSPELRPLPPLLIQQSFRQDSRNNAEVVSSKDDESESFYSPKGSINGKDSSIGTGSASRRTFAAIEMENFNGSTSDSTCTYSSSVPGSGSGSPMRSASLSLSPVNNLSRTNSMPKSPDLIEIQTAAPLPPHTLSPPEMGDSLLQASASPSPPSSSSPDRYSRRSEESSPRVSNASDRNVESPAIGDLVLPESASPLPPISMSPERYLNKSEESSPRNSNASNQNEASPVKISSSVRDLPLSSSSPERLCEESPRNSNVSDQNTESPVRISSVEQQNSADIPTALPESASQSPPGSRNLRSESSPRNSNVSDQNSECPVRISSLAQNNSTDIPTAMEMQALVFPESASQSPPGSRNLTSEESSSRNSNVESPVRISSPSRHDSNDIPTASEMQAPMTSESAPPYSPGSSSRNSNVESPARFSSPSHQDSNDIPIASEMQAPMASESAPPYSPGSGEKEELSPMVSNASDENTIVTSTLLEMKDLALLSPERYSQRSEESSPRISNASDQNVASPVRICSSEEHNSQSQIRSSMPDSGSEESSSMILNNSEQNVESPVENGSSVQHNATVIPSPPPPPPALFPVFVPSMQPPVSIIPPPPVSIPPRPPPPPPPLIKAWDSSPKTPTPPAKMPIGPPALRNPLKPIAFDTPPLISPIQLASSDSQTVKNDGEKESPNMETECENVDLNGESPPKPKLKPLHWDKVRASSDREMVWDQLKCSSTFELNEEMIETLFVVSAPKPNPKEATRWQVLPSPGQDNADQILDPKKAQNIAILLKAFHVTVDEVCEGLLEGNADILGTELLESLLKMAPTKEEERKLKEYKDDSPMKLGPAERFLKAVVDIPHAFRRVEAILYISNFESEVEYLKKSFTTLEAACEELRMSRMFLKLLEAVLKTGNRMNVGTNRGDAHAFKLDTLLKLVDVKGADGKTTLLHFVVQEIIRSEGARLSGGVGSQESSSMNDDAKCRKLGLQVVSALSCELSNVKKAAVMDAEMLSSDVSKLSKGIEDAREVVKLNEEICLQESKFSESINSFIEKGEEEIFRIQAQENLAMSLVKEITEYFHGDSAKEEAHPFRIFMVVRDFLTSLDRVCKEVGMINERTIISSAHKFPVPVNPLLQQASGSDDESLPLNV